MDRANSQLLSRLASRQISWFSVNRSLLSIWGQRAWKAQSGAPYVNLLKKSRNTHALIYNKALSNRLQSRSVWSLIQQSPHRLEPSSHCRWKGKHLGYAATCDGQQMNQQWRGWSSRRTAAACANHTWFCLFVSFFFQCFRCWNFAVKVSKTSQMIQGCTELKFC